MCTLPFTECGTFSWTYSSDVYVSCFVGVSSLSFRSKTICSFRRHIVEKTSERQNNCRRVAKVDLEFCMRETSNRLIAINFVSAGDNDNNEISFKSVSMNQLQFMDNIARVYVT